MKNTFHPLAFKVLGLRATLIPGFLSIANYALTNNTYIPEKLLNGGINLIVQIIVVLVVEFLLHWLINYLNERHRIIRKEKLEKSRSDLSNRLPSLNGSLLEKAQNKINEIDGILIDLDANLSTFDMDLPEKTEQP